MKTIPEPIQNCHHRLQNCNDTRILNPSNSTDLENRQGSTAYPNTKTVYSEPFLNCLRTAETNWNVSIPSNSMGLKLKQNHEKHQNQPNLQPLAGEFSPSGNLLIMASQQSKACCNQLPSPEAIPERLRLCICSAESNIDDNQLEAY